jgi:hypothetical protein
VTDECVVEECDENAECFRYCVEHWRELPDVVHALEAAYQTESRWEAFRETRRANKRASRWRRYLRRLWSRWCL